MKFFLDHIIPHLQNKELNIVDVGARNGFRLFPESLSKYCNLYGYEPNPEEFTKLINEKTDLQLSGVTLPKFKSKKYFSTALTNNKGEVDFFVTNGPGACNLMGETNKKITENMFLDVNKNTSYEKEHVDVKNKIIVETDKLENLLNQLKALNANFKLITSCMILEQVGSGLTSTSVSFWDEKTDGCVRVFYVVVKSRWLC